jgi:flavin reductase (DIM6/NTAB) family NADH-FMN oxidoreductase RutF
VSELADPAAITAVDAVHRLLDPPLWLVTSVAEHRRGGCIATFVARASIVTTLPRMLAGIARHHHTWQLIESSGCFALHLLPADGLDLVRRFGLASGHDRDKLEGLAAERTPLGNPLLPAALSWLDCRVETALDSGDRSLYLAAVTGGAVLAADRGPPLTAGTLTAGLTPAEQAEMDRLYRRDLGIDAEAIRAWRRRSLPGG